MIKDLPYNEEDKPWHLCTHWNRVSLHQQGGRVTHHCRSAQCLASFSLDVKCRDRLRHAPVYRHRNLAGAEPIRRLVFGCR